MVKSVSQVGGGGHFLTSDRFRANCMYLWKLEVFVSMLFCVSRRELLCDLGAHGCGVRVWLLKWNAVGYALTVRQD